MSKNKRIRFGIPKFPIAFPTYVPEYSFQLEVMSDLLKTGSDAVSKFPPNGGKNISQVTSSLLDGAITIMFCNAANITNVRTSAHFVVAGCGICT